MIEAATGLVLRTRPFTETSLIVHWLTSDLGRLATVAKGARRTKSPFHGKLDLFYQADFSFSRSRRSELHTLAEVSLRDARPALRRDMSCLQQAAYATALVEQTTETETPLPRIYEMMQGFLNVLHKQPAQPQSVFALELKLLQQLGLTPDWGHSRLSAGAKRIAEALTLAAWDSIASIKPSAAQLSELRQFLHGFLIYHLGKIPSNRAEALRV